MLQSKQRTGGPRISDIQEAMPPLAGGAEGRLVSCIPEPAPKITQQGADSLRHWRKGGYCYWNFSGHRAGASPFSHVPRPSDFPGGQKSAANAGMVGDEVQATK